MCIHTSLLAEKWWKPYVRWRDHSVFSTSKSELAPRSVALPTQMVSVFRQFATWLYSGQLVPALSADRTSPLQTALPGDSQRLVPSKTYVKHPNTLLEEADLIRLHKFCLDEQIPELANLAATTLLLQNDRLRRTAAIGAIRFPVRQLAVQSTGLSRQRVRKISTHGTSS